LSADTADTRNRRSEGLIIFLVGAIQLINILDFVIVMPMGPDLARGVGISTRYVGLIGGSYTLAAALSGLAGLFFLDRFDRRKAVAVAMFGLVVGTAAGGFAWGLGSLMAARVIAGLFGGPATSLSMAIVADVIPPERRGAALSKVMSAFSLAMVLGVPLALEISQRAGWRWPFFTVAGLGVVVVAVAVTALPALRLHLDKGPTPHHHAVQEALEIARTRDVQISYLITAVVMAGGFILIPNISAYVQDNIGYPREHLGTLYLAGGVASFAVMLFAGRLVDQYGSFRIGTLGALMLSVTVYVGFVHYPAGFPVMAIYVAFMASTALRNVSYSTLASRVPQPRVRARFMSLQSVVQHLASTAGAFASTLILGDVPTGQPLEHVDVLATVTIILCLALPPLLWALQGRVLARERGLKLQAEAPQLQPATR